MSSANITARLMAALPESIWAEANRRLRLVPELWKLAEDEQVLEALCKLGGDENQWRPGNIALTAYAAKHPECQATGAEAWFFGDGRERIGTAYAQLTGASPALALHPLEQALPVHRSPFANPPGTLRRGFPEAPSRTRMERGTGCSRACRRGDRPKRFRERAPGNRGVNVPVPTA